LPYKFIDLPISIIHIWGLKMIYKTRIKEIVLCGCGYEGYMIIELCKNLLKVYYQANDSFIEEYIIRNVDIVSRNSLQYKFFNNDKAIFPLDLWLVYGKCKKLNTCDREYPISINECGGKIKGEIVSLINKDEIRVDCGIIIDVDNELSIDGLIKGDFIETAGTYQVYFPETEFSKY